MVLLILLKIVLTLVTTPGMIAPAAIATNPAINAYSIRSCPRVSFQILSFQPKLASRFKSTLSSLRMNPHCGWIVQLKSLA